MFVLKVLGGAVVEGDSGLLTGRAAHRRRVALLALLASAPTGMLGREKLAAYLWPDRDSERARHALSESLYVLRKALGENAFLTTGDEVGLAAEAVTSDLARFEAALAAGELEEAAALYAGPFLDGFFVDDAPEFERWAESERERLARAYATALERLAEGREAEEDWLGALEWWRRLAAHDPYSSRGALRLMLALEAAGEHAAAIQHAAAHAVLLEEELGVAPDPEVTALAERLRSEPARMREVALTPPQPRSTATAPAAPAAPRQSEPPAPSPTLPPRPGRRSRVPMFAALLFVLLAAIGVGALYLERGGEELAAAEPTLKPTRIAVLFFDDFSPGGELAYLANGITSALIHELSQIVALEVISQNGVLPFREKNVALDSIAGVLGTGTIVTGSVSRAADRLRVNVRVIDAATSLNLQSQVQERPWSETFALIDDVVREVSFALRRELGSSVQLRRWQAQTSSVQAWQLTNQAAELRQSARSLHTAGETEAALARLDNAEQLLAQAEALDPRWPEPIVVRGWIAQSRAFFAFRPPHRDIAAVHRWREEGIAHADRALALDPDHAGARELRGTLRYQRVVYDRPADAAENERWIRAAEADLRAAVAADPTRARAWTDLSSIEYDRGNFAAARQAAERAYRADAFAGDVQQTLLRLFESSFELGEDEAAARWCDELRSRFAVSYPYAFCVLTLHAWSQHAQPDPAAAWAVVEQGLASAPPALRQTMRPRYEMMMAVVLARAGLGDSAEAVIQRAREASRNDPDLFEIEAGARILLRQPDAAVALLRGFAEARPGHYPSIVRSRRFASVRERAGGPVLAGSPDPP